MYVHAILMKYWCSILFYQLVSGPLPNEVPSFPRYSHIKSLFLNVTQKISLSEVIFKIQLLLNDSTKSTEIDVLIVVAKCMSTMHIFYQVKKLKLIKSIWLFLAVSIIGKWVMPKTNPKPAHFQPKTNPSKPNPPKAPRNPPIRNNYS